MGDISAPPAEGLKLDAADELLRSSNAALAHEAGSLDQLVRHALQGSEEEAFASLGHLRKPEPKHKQAKQEVGAALWAAPPARFRNPLLGPESTLASADALKRASLAMGPSGTSETASRVLEALGLLMPTDEAAALAEAMQQQMLAKREALSAMGPWASAGSSTGDLPSFPMPDGMSREYSDRLMSGVPDGADELSLGPVGLPLLSEADALSCEAKPARERVTAAHDEVVDLDPVAIPPASAACDGAEQACAEAGDTAPESEEGDVETSAVRATAWWSADAPAWLEVHPADDASAAAAAAGAAGAETQLRGKFARVLAAALCEPAASCRLLFRPSLALTALVRKAAALSGQAATIALASPAEACESLSDVIYPALLSVFAADELDASAAGVDIMSEVAAVSEFAKALGADPDEAAKLFQASLATSASSVGDGAAPGQSGKRHMLGVAKVLLSTAQLDDHRSENDDAPAGSDGELKAAFEAAGTCTGSSSSAVARLCDGLSSTLALRLAVLGAVAKFDSMDPALEAKALNGAQLVAAAWSDAPPTSEEELPGLPAEVQKRIARLDADIKAAAATLGNSTATWSSATTIPSKLLLGTWYPQPSPAAAAAGSPS